MKFKKNLVSSKDSDQCLIDHSSSSPAIIGLPSVRESRTNPIIQPSLLGRPKSGLGSFSRTLPHALHLTHVTSHIGWANAQQESSESETFRICCKRIAICFVHGASSPAKNPVTLERTNQPETVHKPNPKGAEQ